MLIDIQQSENIMAKTNVIVTEKECRGNVERMIRKFMKKVKKERIIEEYRSYEYFKSPSVKRKEKSIRARRQKAADERRASRRRPQRETER